jgi:hypothetical protein
MKEVSLPEKGSKVVAKVSQVCSLSKKHVGYARRVKKKFAKQLHKNKELFNEVVADTSEKGKENYLEVVLDALKFTSNMGLNCGEGGDEKGLLNLISKIEEERKPTSKVKGKRELKNLNVPSIMRLERDLLWRGVIARGDVLGQKMRVPFPQRCIRGFGFLGAGGGICCESAGGGGA